MSKLLELLISLSVAGSTVVLCILLLRFVSPSVFPAKGRYVLGKIAVGLYLLPVAVILKWLWSFFMEQETTPTSLTGFPSSLQQTQHGLPATAIPELNLSADIALLFLSIWGIGAFVFAIWQVYCYRRFIRTFQQTGIPVAENSEVARQLALLKEVLGIQSNVRLAYHSAVRSPVLVGLWKPTIYLPVGNTSNVNMDMVLHHELIHLKRKDLWVKALALGAGALHWWNPFVHILRKDLHTWCECSCDEEVVKDMSYSERKRYGETILNVMAGSSSMPIRFSASLSSGGKQLKRRLNMMLNVKKMKKRTVIVAIAMLIFVGAISASSAVWASKNVPGVQAETSSHDNQTLEHADRSVSNKKTKVMHYYQYDALLPNEKELVSKEMALYNMEDYEGLVPYEELTPDEQNRVTKEDGIYTSKVIEKIK